MSLSRHYGCDLTMCSSRIDTSDRWAEDAQCFTLQQQHRAHNKLFEKSPASYVYAMLTIEFPEHDLIMDGHHRLIAIIMAISGKKWNLWLAGIIIVMISN